MGSVEEHTGPVDQGQRDPADPFTAADEAPVVLDPVRVDRGDWLAWVKERGAEGTIALGRAEVDALGGWPGVEPRASVLSRACNGRPQPLDLDPTYRSTLRRSRNMLSRIAGNLHNWEGDVRVANNTPANSVAWEKNWRNFPHHVGWMEQDGKLTDLGLRAHHTALIYGAKSKMFAAVVARCSLLQGKHLILINAINEYQDHELSSNGGCNRSRGDCGWQVSPQVSSEMLG